MSYDWLTLNTAMQQTAEALTRHPVSLGRNMPQLAAAISYEALQMESAMSRDMAFGWKSFKKFGKKAYHIAKKAAELGAKYDVPGAHLVSSALNTVDDAVKHVKDIHRKAVSARKDLKMAAGQLHGGIVNL
jgi:hypothetical protein